jgi:L-lactate dehydrogenase complex protein LldG
MATRAEFLARIRREAGRSGGLFPATPAPRPPEPREAAEAIRRQMAERWPEALSRFVREFEAVGGVFHRVGGEPEAAAVIRDLALARESRSLVAWEPEALGLDLLRHLAPAGIALTVAPPGGGEPPRLAHREAAARAPLGVTGADWVLAETGTLVLVSGSGRPRTTSLLPEVHVAVFGAPALLESLAQLGVMLEAFHADRAALTGAVVNLVTGPSRTADIELTLTRGVHGPKEVHAVFVDAWSPR